MNRSILVCLAILMAAFYVSRSVAGGESDSALEAFTQRPVWNVFPSSFLQVLAGRFETPSRAADFASFAERSGILQSRITGSDLDDPEWGIAQTAISVSSYGYMMAQSDRYAEARQAWDFALLLAPRHVPAWVGMAILSVNEQDCNAARLWAEKVLSYRPDPGSNDPIEIASAQAMAGEGEREAADAFDNPEILGNTSAVINQMREIKAMCRGRR